MVASVSTMLVGATMLGAGAVALRSVWARVTRSTGAVAEREAGDRFVAERWVNLEYVQDIGLLQRLEEEGYELKWCGADSLARWLDKDGWELVKVATNGGMCIVRLWDPRDSQTLIKRSMCTKPPADASD